MVSYGAWPADGVMPQPAAKCWVNLSRWLRRLITPRPPMNRRSAPVPRPARDDIGRRLRDQVVGIVNPIAGAAVAAIDNHIQGRIRQAVAGESIGVGRVDRAA